jgi:hypothetical protein
MVVDEIFFHKLMFLPIEEIKHQMVEQHRIADSKLQYLYIQLDDEGV